MLPELLCECCRRTMADRGIDPDDPAATAKLGTEILIRAMERLCETGVLEAQERRGYFVRREPRYRKIVCLTPSDIADYSEELSSLLKEEAEKAGFESSLVDMPDNASGVAMLPKLKADAVLFIPYAHEEITPEQLNRIMAQPMPVIITYGTVSVGGCRYVDGDNEFSGVLAATYLLMNGHQAGNPGV